MLDLKFVDGAVQLCASCVFTLRDLVLANDRLGTGPAYDFFTGEATLVVVPQGQPWWGNDPGRLSLLATQHELQQQAWLVVALPQAVR